MNRRFLRYLLISLCFSLFKCQASQMAVTQAPLSAPRETLNAGNTSANQPVDLIAIPIDDEFEATLTSAIKLIEGLGELSIFKKQHQWLIQSAPEKQDDISILFVGRRLSSKEGEITVDINDTTALPTICKVLDGSLSLFDTNNSKIRNSGNIVVCNFGFFMKMLAFFYDEHEGEYYKNHVSSDRLFFSAIQRIEDNYMPLLENYKKENSGPESKRYRAHMNEHMLIALTSILGHELYHLDKGQRGEARGYLELPLPEKQKRLVYSCEHYRSMLNSGMKMADVERKGKYDRIIIDGRLLKKSADPEKKGDPFLKEQVRKGWDVTIVDPPRRLATDDSEEGEQHPGRSKRENVLETMMQEGTTEKQITERIEKETLQTRQILYKTREIWDEEMEADDFARTILIRFYDRAVQEKNVGMMIHMANIIVQTTANMDLYLFYNKFSNFAKNECSNYINKDYFLTRCLCNDSSKYIPAIRSLFSSTHPPAFLRGYQTTNYFYNRVPADLTKILGGDVEKAVSSITQDQQQDMAMILKYYWLDREMLEVPLRISYLACKSYVAGYDIGKFKVFHVYPALEGMFAQMLAGKKEFHGEPPQDVHHSLQNECGLPVN